MDALKNIPEGERILYKDNIFSGNYDQSIFLKKANDDGSHRPKYYISAFSPKDGMLSMQGYLYFYLDYETKKSYFVGVKVYPEFRNLNIASFLVATWIDLCLSNGYDFLGVNQKQRKPFLLYLLKTYGFEILDKSLYDTRPDVITICRNEDLLDYTKYLSFQDPKHESSFTKTNIWKEDNYHIIHDLEGFITLDNVILPLQNAKKANIDYQLVDTFIARAKTEETIKKHTK